MIYITFKVPPEVILGQIGVYINSVILDLYLWHPQSLG